MPSRCQNNKEVRSNPREETVDENWIHCFTHIFFHPDYTVGFGVSPNQRTQKELGRGLYRQWGISPRPEDIGFQLSNSLYDKHSGKASPRIMEKRKSKDLRKI